MAETPTFSASVTELDRFRLVALLVGLVVGLLLGRATLE
jgi:hypothetical protein